MNVRVLDRASSRTYSYQCSVVRLFAGTVPSKSYLKVDLWPCFLQVVGRGSLKCVAEELDQLSERCYLPVDTHRTNNLRGPSNH